MTPNELLQEANLMQDDLIAIRRHLHMHPETGFDLADTKSYVKKELIAMGYDPQECGKSGLTALIGNGTSPKIFLLRADMDALPVKEETDIEFASKNENMHACGHDMHTTMLLGAAKLLKSHEKEIQGTIKLMFQPAEELLEGSKDMISAGVLQNPPVTAAMMLHVMPNLPLTTGTAIVCNGGVSAPAADYFTIEIQGKGCHGSSPNNGIDPINIAAHIITALQEIHARELAISDEAALTFGTIHGGAAPNVIPDIVKLEGTMRVYNEDVRSFLKTRIREISQSIANTFRASAKVIFGAGCPTLINDPALATFTQKYMVELLGTQKAFSADKFHASKTSGSEDFSYVSQEIPSIMILLAAGNPTNGYCYPLHHPKVTFDESVLPYGCAIYAYTALRYLTESN